MGGGRGRGGKRKGEDVVHPLKVSLEELFSGTTKKLSLAKNVVCSKCDGCVPGTQGAVCCHLPLAGPQAGPKHLRPLFAPQEGQQERRKLPVQLLPGAGCEDPVATDRAGDGAADADGLPRVQRRRCALGCLWHALPHTCG